MIPHLTIDEADQAERELMRREVEGLEALARLVARQHRASREPERPEPSRRAVPSASHIAR